MPVINVTKKTWLATKVHKADKFLTRLVGLLKRTRIGPEEALWLIPSKGIHTIGMKFPIDVVFLTKRKRVTKVAHEVPRRRIAMALLADSVLELPAGTAARTGTRKGDQLALESSQIAATAC